MMSTAEIKRNAHDDAQNDCQSRNSTIQTYFNEVKECFLFDHFFVTNSLFLKTEMDHLMEHVGKIDRKGKNARFKKFAHDS